MTDISKASVNDWLKSAPSLDDLCERLNALTEDEADVADLAGLPTFGGEDIRDTREVWSWDADCVLLYDGAKGYFTEDRDPEAWYSR